MAATVTQHGGSAVIEPMATAGQDWRKPNRIGQRTKADCFGSGGGNTREIFLARGHGPKPNLPNEIPIETKGHRFEWRDGIEYVVYFSDPELETAPGAEIKPFKKKGGETDVRARKRKITILKSISGGADVKHGMVRPFSFQAGDSAEVP